MLMNYHIGRLVLSSLCVRAFVAAGILWCSFCRLLFFTSYVPNMFRTLIYPSSGACECVDELPHRSSCSQFVVCWSFWCGWYLVVFVLQAEAMMHGPINIRCRVSFQNKINLIHWCI